MIDKLIQTVSKNPAFDEPLKAAILLHGLDDPLNACHFLAQMAHESAGFSVLRENLNYSEQALLRVFPKYFTAEQAKEYARKPIQIANRVYANRMGNGPESSGDGWKFAGKGIIQLTGANNFTFYSNLLFGDDRLVKNPELATEPSTACQIACEFWKQNGLSSLAMADDLDGVSDKINIGRQTAKYGDAIGFAHRAELLASLKKVADL